MGELLERLRAQATAHVPAWAPAEGEGVEGVLLARHERGNEGRRGDPYPVLVIEAEDGRRLAWHAAGEIAAEQLAEHAPEIGDRVAVLFVAEQKSKGGNTFKRWAVAVEHRTNPDDPRDELVAVLNGIEDRALRIRAKATFARVFGHAPQYLPVEQVAEAAAWCRRAVAGEEPLDMPQVSAAANKERGSE